MELKLVRVVSNTERTIGKLYVDGVFECYTMEDRDRKVDKGGVKVKGKTAIGVGTYNVVVNMSNRFKKLLPLLLDVPQFEGIRIHPGNTELDTEGCILPGSVTGDVKKATMVSNSRVAFKKLFDKIQAAIAKGERVKITIVRGE